MPEHSSSQSPRALSTRILHAGQVADTRNGIPTATPLHVATAYSYPSSEEREAVFADNSLGYVYSRFGNPTVRALEEAISVAEGTDESVAYASGMAAIHALFTTCVRPDDTIIASQVLYGATLSLLRTLNTEIGVNVEFVNVLDLGKVQAAIQSRTALIFAESISNPLMEVADIASLATIAHDAGARLAIDNTVASPVVINPAALGADYVVHSTTKFIGGHGDTTGGVIATSSDLAAILRERAKLTGGMPGPFDAWLALRGLRTMHLRLREQCANAEKLAAWLVKDSRVHHVNFPGFDFSTGEGPFTADHRGALLSFEIRNATTSTVFAFLDHLRLCIPAATLGDAQTLVLHPATTSHRGLTPEQREHVGIQDSLVRVSVGIEAITDIITDIDNALTSVLN